MGCLFSAEAKILNATLARKDVIMLQAGCVSGSGRDTIFKQMKIIHGGGFSSDEINYYRPYIYQNAIDSWKEILKAMPELGISFVNNELEIDAKMVMDAPSWGMKSFSEELVAAMKRLWIDLGVQECFALRSNECKLKYSVKYFLENLDRLAAKDYQPTEQVILRTRTLKCFDSVNVSLKSLDAILFKCRHRCVGTTLSRDVYFKNATTMIFCVNMSEYDNNELYRDYYGCENAMHENLESFDTYCNASNFFSNISSIVLLFNKKDIFKEKIKKSPLTICFPEYTGAQEYEEAAAYIQAQFEAKNKSTNKKIYCFKTCGMDTADIQFVLDAVADVIIANNPKSLRIN
ncbi:guanine nucleotide binding protein, alpha activating activity polypeptide O [Daphnia pulex]|uniref:Guanine nucleotide binding protein, alpha activating activity polypeptide O n=1 Tax=Daphnia pulex TaxID=6669 RepID=E9H197_DAPPU|nr:guanine nucleotide binding protein, alpha activating activity polypeptide O [Daphnia pulex]|eukprot:EFX74455.1 guanine nucleotide binding protein, alpha activating activity polypeptide O [Daphnia pulex]